MALSNTWFCSATLAWPKSAGVATVRGPSRRAELIEAVVAAGVHDLAVAAGLTSDDARLEGTVTGSRGIGVRVLPGGGGRGRGRGRGGGLHWGRAESRRRGRDLR